MRRAEAARYGLTMGDVQDVIETAIGDKSITWTVEGRERYSVNLRYPRRPKMMTVTAILVGLLPILWGHGTGADVMKRIAAPMIGGVITSGILELLIYPAIYTLWK